MIFISRGLVKIDGVLDAALAAELEADARAVDLGVRIPHGRQPDRTVVAGIFFVADADERSLEQPDDRGENLLARQARPPQVAPRSAGGSAASARANGMSRPYFASSRTSRHRG